MKINEDIIVGYQPSLAVDLSDPYCLSFCSFGRTTKVEVVTGTVILWRFPGEILLALFHIFITLFRFYLVLASCFYYLCLSELDI